MRETPHATPANGRIAPHSAPAWVWSGAARTPKGSHRRRSDGPASRPSAPRHRTAASPVATRPARPARHRGSADQWPRCDPPTHRGTESFELRTETFPAESIDDASSTPQSFLSGKPATARHLEPHRPWAIRAARPVHAQPHYRSAHQSTCATRFVPVRFAPARPGSSRSGRGRRRRVAVPRLSRDGVPPCLCRRPPRPMTALSGDSVPPGLRPAPSVCRTGADDTIPCASVLP